MTRTQGAIGMLGFSLLLLLGGCGEGSLDGSVSGGDELARERSAIVRPTAQGGRNEVVMVYAVTNFGQNTRACSGTYFAPRVVLTAAHCLDGVVTQPPYGVQLFVYWGDNFVADFPQLTPAGPFLTPPAVGQPSFFAQADSFEQNPSWDPSLIYPDMGVIYLDRKPPFDPLPLWRARLDDSWVGRQVTISGWGGDGVSDATTPTGSKVQRTGLTHVLGTPTAADYHPEDPNPGMLVATVRQNVIKLDGRAPNSNGCFGDSGGPLIINQFGQDYAAGVDYFGGLFCEDYSLYTRLDAFLPFLDAAYKKGGQETLVPNLECVAPNVSGSLTAYFGYNNKNGVGITVPFGSKNQLALDVRGFRNTLFTPGLHPFAFGVDFTMAQTLSYLLAPDNSPRTTLTVNRSSVRCGAAQAEQVECGDFCRAAERSGCGGLPTFQGCMSQCADQVAFTRDIFPECVPLQQAADACVARVAPGVASWSCSVPGFIPSAPGCDDAENALFTCYGF